MGYLGQRSKRGANDPQNIIAAGNWTVKFEPRDINIQSGFEVYHISLQGPLNSRLRVYVDTTFYSNVLRGDVNDWDPSQPLFMTPGQTLYFYWDTASGTAPNVTIFCRQPLPI